MSHLSPDTFIDLLDGVASEWAVVHLSTCEACRQQLSQLRASHAAASSAQVPEPSPLFWDHLSARVHEAIASEAPRSPWWRIGWSWRFAGTVSAAAVVLVLAILLRMPSRVERESGGAQPAPVVAAQPSATVEPSTEDDSLRFVADLASDLDWDRAAEAGLASRGDVERAVAEMDEAERVELRRLLQEALGSHDRFM